MKLHKKLLFAVFAATVGISSAVTASGDPCVDCYNAWWECGGGQNDMCTLRYERCLYNNGCPPLY